MIAYLDSSVLLRIVLKQKNNLQEFSQIKMAVSSRLLKVECLRVLDRLVAVGQLPSKELSPCVEFIYEALEYIEIISLSEPILDRVGHPGNLNLGTLDAIHLFSALSWRLEKGLSPIFLTHDKSLAAAARLLGFSVLGD